MSGDSSVENTISRSESIDNEYLSSLGVPDRYLNLVNSLISKGYANENEIMSKEVFESDFELSSIGEYEGFYIKDPEPGNYNTIAMIAPKDTSVNDTLLLKMIKNYESIKSSEPTGEYLREAKNVCLKQQGGVSIFVVSKNANEIYEIINSNNY